MKPRLHPLDKPRFMESNNQVWCTIYTVIGIGVLIVNGLGFIKDPGPFLTFFTGIGMAFILGASGADVMRAYKVDSSYQTDNEIEEGAISVTNDPKPMYFDDPSI